MRRIGGWILLAACLVGCAAQDANKLYVSAFRQLEKAEAKDAKHRDLEKARVHFAEGQTALTEARYDIASQKFKESLQWSEGIIDPAAYESRMAAKRAEPAPAQSVSQHESHMPSPAASSGGLPQQYSQSTARAPSHQHVMTPPPSSHYSTPKRLPSEPRGLPKDALAKYLAMKRGNKAPSSVASQMKASTPQRPRSPSQPSSAPSKLEKVPPVNKVAPEAPAPVAEVPGARTSQTQQPVQNSLPQNLGSAPQGPVEAPSMPQGLSNSALQPPPAELTNTQVAKADAPQIQTLPTPREIKDPAGMLVPQANTADASDFVQVSATDASPKNEEVKAEVGESDLVEKPELSADAVALAEAQAANDSLKGGPQQTGEEARNLRKAEASKSEVVKAPARPLDKFLPQSARAAKKTETVEVADSASEDAAIAMADPASTKPAVKAAQSKDPTKIPGELGFSPNDASVEPQTMMTLDQTSKFLLENPSSVIQFQGFIGPGESSSLVDTRFESLRAYLVSKGVPEDQVRLAGKRRSGTKAEFQMFLIED